MRATLLVVSLCAVTALSGCAVKKDFYAMGGSRADGTVDMAYDFKQFEQPVVNQEQALSIAQSKCRVWGYRDAEPFGGKTQNCYQMNGYGTCIAGQVIIKYQCHGEGNSSASSAPTSQPAAKPSVSLSREQWKQQQLQKLDQETGLSYDEYQRRYQEILGQ